MESKTQREGKGEEGKMFDDFNKVVNQSKDKFLKELKKLDPQVAKAIFPSVLEETLANEEKPIGRENLKLLQETAESFGMPKDMFYLIIAGNVLRRWVDSKTNARQYLEEVMAVSQEGNKSREDQLIAVYNAFEEAQNNKINAHEFSGKVKIVLKLQSVVI